MARDIAREAARAATGAMQSHVQTQSSSPVTPSSQAVIQSSLGSTAVLGPQEQQQQAGQSLQPNDGPLSLAPCRHGAPFQEIPLAVTRITATFKPH